MAPMLKLVSARRARPRSWITDNALQNSSVFIDESPWFHFDEEINSPAISRPDTNGSPPGSDPAIIQGSASGLDIPYSDSIGSSSKSDLSVVQRSGHSFGIPYSGLTSSPSGSDHFPVSRSANGIGIPYSGSASSSSSSDPSVDPRSITPKNANSTKKRQRSLVPFDRINRARQLPPLAVYEVKQSKKTPGQQRGLLWLTYDAKKKFDEDLAMLLARWREVELGHEGTCVLCPEDWSSAKSSSLQDVQTVAQLLFQTSARKLFQYSDHTITFARAIVWFAEDT
jgi:hypothetical protein